jgi:magnesium transporter
LTNQRRQLKRRLTPYLNTAEVTDDHKHDHPASASELYFVAYDSEKFIDGNLQDLRRIKDELDKWPVLWLNIEGLGSTELIEEIGALFNVHPLALEDVVHVHQRAKYEQYDEHSFLVAHMIEGKDHVHTEQVCLYIGDHFVLSFQEGPIDATKPVVERLKKGQTTLRRQGPDYLAYAIIDSIIDAYYPVLETFGEKLERLEELILRVPSKRIVGRVHRAKRELLALRRALFPLREALGAILRTAPAGFTENTLIHMRDCYDHVVQITDLIETYRELASDLMDVYLSMISYKLNEVMKVLTVITSICAPPSLIAAIYGMNFDRASPYNMPELGWQYGYPYAICLMIVASSTLCFFIFRSDRWTGGLVGKETNED